MQLLSVYAQNKLSAAKPRRVVKPFDGALPTVGLGQRMVAAGADAYVVDVERSAILLPRCRSRLCAQL